jgi:hypothetical protein
MLKITKLIVGGSEKGKGFLTPECIIADVVEQLQETCHPVLYSPIWLIWCKTGLQ